MLTTKTGLILCVLMLLLVSGPVLVSAQTQRVTAQDLDTHLNLARSLAKEKKFEAALKEYLFVFDNSRGVSSYGGVRLSYVPAEIAEIGRSYRPATVALQTRREENEKLALAGKADFSIMNELTALNQYLDESERNIVLYDKLKAMGPAYSEVKGDLVIMIWQQLVAAKRYEELKDQVHQLAKTIASQIAESAINNDFPDNGGVFSSDHYQSYLRSTIIGEGGSVYETLLALGKAELASKLAKWMFTFASDGEMYARLINSAINANRNDIAADLVERANKSLKRVEDLRLVDEAARRLPKVK